MLNQIAEIARQAGNIILSCHDAAIHKKEGHFNFVTDADIRVQSYVKEALCSLLPEAAFFAEEQENAPLTAAPTFVVDPIDGTLNFMRHRNCSAVSIALLQDKRPVCGAVYNPFADELFSAELGKGAFLNGAPISAARTPIENAMVLLGTSPYDEDLHPATIRAAQLFLSRAGDLRRSGSAAVDLCDIACGRGDVFFELRLRPWDVAAGALLVEEAGGRFYSIGHDAPYFDGPCGILACGSACADAAWNILSEALR